MLIVGALAVSFSLNHLANVDTANRVITTRQPKSIQNMESKTKLSGEQSGSDTPTTAPTTPSEANNATVPAKK
jgi:hypothetical protein